MVSRFFWQPFQWETGPVPSRKNGDSQPYSKSLPNLDTSFSEGCSAACKEKVRPQTCVIPPLSHLTTPLLSPTITPQPGSRNYYRRAAIIPVQSEQSRHPHPHDETELRSPQIQQLNVKLRPQDKMGRWGGLSLGS